ncbi:MAG: endonuclease/exonuclease/phosphatase family protein [Bacteroidales bacterium]|nr:endonuclease/exonuclease/phosphatase family protein [Bacteroidales bacterium]
MKRIILTVFTALVALTAAAQPSFTVGSYNIRYDASGDRDNGDGWELRSKAMIDMINYERWEIFGAQEVLDHQLRDLMKGLVGYDYIGVGRDDGAKAGEYAPIFFRKDRMRCLESGQFWLSETPETVGSRGWDAACPRICTWGRFEDKSTKWKFWFFNLHMDHIGVEARREGARLVLAKIKEMCGDGQYILTGDFNVDQNSEIYDILTASGLLKDAYQEARHRMFPTGTTNTFKVEYRTENRIDHVFLSPRFRAHEYGVLTPVYWTENVLSGKQQKALDSGRKDVHTHKARMISDHYPVVVRVELPRLRAPQDWAQYGYYENKNKEVKSAPKVLFMGDSITEGWYSNRPEFFHENNYLGRGIGGQVTAQMLVRFRSDVINHNPETVVILAGTNDIAMNQGYVSLDHIFENIVSMAELATCNGIKVVLCSVLPADSYSWSWEVDRDRAIRSIRELNDRLQAYAAANGHEYADYFSAMADDNRAMKKEYQQDSVHPNVAGYVVMEGIIQKILNK